MLGQAVDIFRLRQYFNAATRVRALAEDLRDDAGLIDDLRRAVIALPFEQVTAMWHGFPRQRRFRAPDFEGRRVALMATGGSGAMASLVGTARALEEARVRPSVISLCSGSAMFGFPIAAGVPAAEVARFTTSLRPTDYIDVAWARLAALLPTAGRGFAGILDGDRIEATFHRLVGDVTLGDLPIPAYAPIWNVEHNRLEFLGPRTHPEVPVARAIRMAIALPLLIEPVALGDGSWCDGGIVDIFPVRPVLDIEDPCDIALAINGFYPPGFAGEDETGWRDRRWSILDAANQVRTCQQVELARINLERLRSRVEVRMIEPVPYERVRGAGFYRQFLSNRDWPQFMLAGHARTRQELAHSTSPPSR